MVEQRSTRSNILGAFAAGLIVTAFCAILLWHDPLVFWNDDYELSILPVFADVARSWSEGHWPLLSPYSWVCGNLAGEFQYGTFSIFVNAAVVLIWKFPLTFPQQAAALSIAHLFVLAAGAFLLARGRNLSFPLSIFVALVAALNGWIICWGATDWFGALGAFAWLPWAWWAMEKSLRWQPTPNVQRSTHNIESASALGVKRWTLGVGRFLSVAIWPAPFVYLVITGGFPYTVVMLALLVVWLAIRSMVETKRLTNILPMLMGVMLGVGLAAPAWMAILDYVRGSAREVQESSAHWQWIVPWHSWPGLILPCWTVKWADFSTKLVPHSATELACGLVAPAALIAGFIWRPRLLVRRMKWDLILLVIVLFLCMVPTAGLFRWSFRWLPLFHLVLALCAAHTLQLRPGSPTAAAAFLLLVLITVAMWMFDTGGRYVVEVTMSCFLLVVVWVSGEFFLRDVKFHHWSPAAASFGIFLLTYLCIPPNCGVPKYNLSQDLTKPAPLDPQRLYLSIYPPAEWTYRTEFKPKPVGQVVRPGSTSMWAGLRFINGYSPIRPAGIARELNAAIHGELDPDIARTLLHDDSGALAELGVDGIVIAREVYDEPQSLEWQLAFQNEEGRVFHRPGPAFQTVRSVKWLDSRPDTVYAIASISNIKDSRNRVEADVAVPNDSPALLKFTRPFFRGYNAWLNGKSLPVDSYRGLIPVIEVPADSHGRLTLSYCPTWLVVGGTISLICAAFACISVFWAWRVRL